MNKEFYDALDEFTISVTRQLKNLHYYSVKNIQVNKVLNNMSQILMKFKKELEDEYNLADTVIIDTVNQCNDYINKYITNTGKRKDILKDLGVNVDRLQRKLKESVSITNNTLSLVLIIKNSSYSIQEWIEYHRIVGVDHFYIYDNESSDNLYEKLSNYINEGIVTYAYWPGQIVQLDAYNDAIKKYKYDTKYLGAIDDDEFIVPIEGERLPEIIDEIFNKYPNCAALGVNWRMYGSSFYEKKKEGLILENYKYRAEDAYILNRHIKTICNPRLTIEFVNPHFATYDESYYCIGENGQRINGPFFENSVCSRIRINHYYSKSREDFFKKIKRGWPTIINQYPGDDEVETRYKELCEDLNKIYDTLMDKYIEELKTRCVLE